MRISDWSSDVCSSDLRNAERGRRRWGKTALPSRRHGGCDRRITRGGRLGLVRPRRSVDDDAFRLRRPPDAQPRRAGAPDLARLLRPATRHVAGTRHGGVRERRELSDGLARRAVWTPGSEERRSGKGGFSTFEYWGG